ncbi:Glutaredoxin, partial [Promicromonospora umidemergens]|nr:Glutaredoxin [Promicromonospora umidemergens]
RSRWTKPSGVRLSAARTRRSRVRRLVPSDCATKATLNGSALDAKGILYDIVDLSENDAALEYVKELGYSQAPVVVVDDQDHWSGFRPDKIERVAKRAILPSDAS